MRQKLKSKVYKKSLSSQILPANHWSMLTISLKIAVFSPGRVAIRARQVSSSLDRVTPEPILSPVSVVVI